MLDWLAGDAVPATTVRTLLVYSVTLLVVRLGSKRFLSKASAFDTVVAIMLGSIMSRAITDGADMWPTMLTGALLVAAHWLIALLAYHSNWFGSLVKGEPRTLVRDGQIDRDQLRGANLSEKDLEQALRQARVTDVAHVRLAVLERGGEISVIPDTRHS